MFCQIKLTMLGLMLLMCTYGTVSSMNTAALEKHSTMTSSIFLDLSKDSLGCFVNPHDIVTDSFKQKLSDVMVIDLSHQQWDSKDFTSFTTLLTPLEKHLPKVVVLDISFNKIDSAAAQALMAWMRLSLLRFINLIFTDIDLVNIGTLYKELCKLGIDGQELTYMMRKVIFTSEEGAAKFVEQRGLGQERYEQYIRDGILSSSWPKQHKEFYNDQLLQVFKKFKLAQAWNKSATGGHQSKSATIDLNGGFSTQDDESQSSEDEEWTFQEAYGKLSGNGMDLEYEI